MQETQCKSHLNKKFIIVIMNIIYLMYKIGNKMRNSLERVIIQLKFSSLITVKRTLNSPLNISKIFGKFPMYKNILEARGTRATSTSLPPLVEYYKKGLILFNNTTLLVLKKKDKKDKLSLRNSKYSKISNMRLGNDLQTTALMFLR